MDCRMALSGRLWGRWTAIKATHFALRSDRTGRSTPLEGLWDQHLAQYRGQPRNQRVFHKDISVRNVQNDNPLCVQMCRKQGLQPRGLPWLHQADDIRPIQLFRANRLVCIMAKASKIRRDPGPLRGNRRRCPAAHAGLATDEKGMQRHPQHVKNAKAPPQGQGFDIIPC
jgi:hypothetical protein